MSIKKLDLLEGVEIKVNQDNMVEIKNGDVIQKVYDENGFDKDRLSLLRDINGEVSKRLTDVAGKAMTTHLQAEGNEDIEGLSFEHELPHADFGVAITRPAKKKGNKLERDEVKANIASYVKSKGLDSTNEVRDELASMWDD